jgi:glutaredoxin-like YruB-family protein
MKKVTIYSTPTCHYCNLAKDFLKEHNVAYTEYDVAADVKKRKEMVDKTGQMGVPVIDVEGEIMVGYGEEALAKALGIEA